MNTFDKIKKGKVISFEKKKEQKRKKEEAEVVARIIEYGKKLDW